MLPIIQIFTNCIRLFVKMYAPPWFFFSLAISLQSHPLFSCLIKNRTHCHLQKHIIPLFNRFKTQRLKCFSFDSQTLSGLPDQDSFYDVVDCLEELGIEAISQRHLNKKGTDLDLVEQFNIYEVT